MDGDIQTHYRACNLCEAICGIEIRHRGDVIVSVRGDPADPLSRGYICPKAVALTDLHNDPDRLTHPRVREGRRWRDVSWDEAFDLIAERWHAIVSEHGADALASYHGNPTVHNYGLMTHSGHLFGHIKTRNRYTATSVDQLPHQLVAWWLYGHQLLIPVPDIDRTQFILMLGANPLASNGSLWTVPDVRNRIKALRERGGELVVIDPRRSETAARASAHHFIRPGSDAALLLALLNVVLNEVGARPRELAAFVDGLDEVADWVAPFTPARAAVATGIDAATIGALARSFAAAESAVCYGRMGVSTQRYGTLCQWAIQMLNIATGNLDRPGGAMFTLPAFDLVARMRPGSFGRWTSRVRGLPEFGGELPVAALAEEILTPGEGQIRALTTVAGNPVLSTPNGARLDEALRSLDFMVSIDPYLNETTRHAHVILPPSATLHRDHYDMTFGVFAVRNTAKYSAPMLDKPADALHDWEILSALGAKVAARFGRTPKPPVTPVQVAAAAIEAGPYGEASGHEAALTLGKLKANPHGIDLGPLEPQLPGRLMTKHGRIVCTPEPVRAALAEAREALLAGDRERGLTLIGRRHLRDNNSWMHNCRRLMKGPPRHALLMHPDDLAARGLGDGDAVRVESRVGCVTLPVQASDTMMRGVVSLPHGYGHGRPGTQQRIAAERPGASVNDLTDERWLDTVSGNAALNGVRVQVVRAD